MLRARTHTIDDHVVVDQLLHIFEVEVLTFYVAFAKEKFTYNNTECREHTYSHKYNLIIFKILVAKPKRADIKVSIKCSECTCTVI